MELDALFARGTPLKTSSVELPSPTAGGKQAREQDDSSPNSIYVGSDHLVSCASNNVEDIEELHEDENELAILKRKRVPTRNIALSRKRKAGVKIKVDVSGESRRLIGEDAQSFISKTSCVIQKFGKWRAPKWDLLSKYKDEGSNKTKDDVCIEVVEHVPGYVHSRGPQKPRLSAKNIAKIEEARKKDEQAEQRISELEIQVKAQQELMEKLEN
ncbi:hypothetical protein ACH5RR_003390 [Cinchona calisaya]|uniref:Uncharacterized protein n=1 Tax=Cinchona calisaya TaxID=153742 RepID=A0ABD3AUN9_9GENT